MAEPEASGGFFFILNEVKISQDEIWGLLLVSLQVLLYVRNNRSCYRVFLFYSIVVLL